MSGWFLLGGTLVFFLVALVALTLRPKTKEGYSSVVSNYVDSARLLNNQLQMGGSDPIYTKAALTPTEITLLNQAVAQPSSLLQPTPPVDYSPLFVEDPRANFTRTDNEKCRKATHPNQLPPSSSKIRCAWWFVADPGTASVGALGTYEGPLFKDTVPKGGVWMWDLIEAGKKEDLKRCKRLKACAFLDAYNAMPGVRCGFCPTLGHGVPIDGAGGVLYPDEGGCDDVIAKGDQCPSPAEGGGGGVIGQAGGTPSFVGICTPTENGLISVACRIAIAKMMGLSPEGGFIQSQTAGVEPPEVKRAHQTLGSYIPSMPWWKDVNSMVRWGWSVVQAQKTGPTNAIRNAAYTLATGTPADYCPSDPVVKGPFDLECMQQLFRQKGCQPAGKRYPVQQDAVNTSMKSWGDLNAEYTGIKSGMNSTEKETQDKAVSDCLGIAVSRDRAPCKPPLLPLGGNDPTLEGFANPGPAGWRAFPLNGWLTSISIGSDGVIMGSNGYGDTYKKGSIEANWESMNMGGMKYIDCANYGQVVATSFDGGVFRFRNNTWTRLPLTLNGTAVGNGSSYSCVYATVNANGLIGVVVSNGQYNTMSFTDNDADLKYATPGDWITYGPDWSSAALVKSTSKVSVNTSRGSRTVEPPAGVSLAKIFMSKSSNDLLAISTDTRLFGLDVDSKWSEMPNPLKIAYAGLNKDRIVGAVDAPPSSNLWTKPIRDTSQSKVGYNLQNHDFRQVNPPGGSTPDVCAEECTKDPECGGWTSVDGGTCYLKKPGAEFETHPLGNAITSGRVSGIKVGFDIEGDNYRQVFRPLGTSTPTDCVNDCKNDPECGGVTSVINHSDRDSCWLKRNPGGTFSTRHPHMKFFGDKIASAKIIRTEGIKVGMDLGGRDIRQIYRPLGSSTPAQCAEDCKKDPACAEWTSLNNYTPWGTDICFLKNPGGTYTSHPFGGAIASGKIDRSSDTGMKVGFNLHNHDFRQVRNPNMSPSMCAEECRNDPKCGGWTQLHDTCYLKTEGATRFDPWPNPREKITSALVDRKSVGPLPFTVLEKTVMGTGTWATPFTNKGLEQLKKECRETPNCVGFNYSTKDKSGAFLLNTETGAASRGVLVGDWIGISVPVELVAILPSGERVYIALHGTYTKMVSSSGVAKYYVGLPSAFNASSWNTYNDATGHYIALAPPEDYAYYRMAPRPKEPKAVMIGDWIGPTPIPIERVVPIPSGERFYITLHGPYTKMVSSSGVARYYVGPTSAFDASRWNTYNDATGHYILKFESS